MNGIHVSDSLTSTDSGGSDGSEAQSDDDASLVVDDTAVSQYKYDDDPYIDNRDDVDDVDSPTLSPTPGPSVRGSAEPSR